MDSPMVALPTKRASKFEPPNIDRKAEERQHNVKALIIITDGCTFCEIGMETILPRQYEPKNAKLIWLANLGSNFSGPQSAKLYV